MPRGPYKKYLYSNEKIPKTTAYNRNKSRCNANKLLQPSTTINQIAQSEKINEKENALPLISGVTVNRHIFSNHNAEERHKNCDETRHVFVNNNVGNNTENQFPGILENSINNNNGDHLPHHLSSELLNNSFLTYNRMSEGKKNNPLNEQNIENNNNNEKVSNDFTSSTNDYLNNKVCMCSNTTTGEALLTIMAIGVRHSLSWTALEDILQAFNLIHNKKTLPDTKFLLKKYFPPQIDTAKYHLYCPQCKAYLGERKQKTGEIVCSCEYILQINRSQSYFIEFKIESQLQNLLKNPSIVANLKTHFKNRLQSNGTTLKDIYDGAAYKRYISSGLLDSWKNISCTFNTDGCQHAKSSKYSVWPIFLKINELPLDLRNKHILLAGLWIDKKEPDMNLFLKPFVHQANQLTSKGFTWTINRKFITSKLFFICCSVDSPCRCSMLSMKQYTGYYGCTYCEHPCVNIQKTRKYVLLEKRPKNRTDESIKTTMVKIGKKELAEGTKGVMGPSILINLNHFDLVSGMPPDYMHACLLGVTRQFTELVLSSVKQEYYIGIPDKLLSIDDRLTRIKPPSVIHRTPRSINERKLWKASEWQSWLLYYSLPCLWKILPSKYLEHWSLYVAAMKILLNDEVLFNELKRARKLLKQFVEKFQEYYGEFEMKYNIHLMLHLCDSVKNWGPLWTQNTFDFENQNRLLLQLKHSPKNISTQIATRLLSFQSMTSFSESVKVSQRVEEFCQNLHQKKLHWYQKLEKYVLVGNGKKYNLEKDEKDFLRIPVQTCTAFSQIIINKMRFTTNSYVENQCSNIDDSIVLLKNKKIGIISKIWKIETESGDSVTFILISELEIIKGKSLLKLDIATKHIERVNLNGNLKIYRPEDIVNLCVLMNIDNEYYVATISQRCHGC